MELPEDRQNGEGECGDCTGGPPERWSGREDDSDDSDFSDDSDKRGEGGRVELPEDRQNGEGECGGLHRRAAGTVEKVREKPSAHRLEQ